MKIICVIDWLHIYVVSVQASASATGMEMECSTTDCDHQESVVGFNHSACRLSSELIIPQPVTEHEHETVDIGTQTVDSWCHCCTNDVTLKSTAVHSSPLNPVVSSVTTPLHTKAASLYSSQHATPSLTTQHTDTPFSSQLTTSDSQLTDNHTSDATYDPDQDLDSDMDQMTTDKQVEVEDIQKYLVFETELDKLFIFCSHPNCRARIIKTSKHSTGSMLTVTATCEYYHTVIWHSQPCIRRMPVGNLLISAAILLSGSSFAKVEKFSELLRMPILSESQFYNIQKTYLQPTVNEFWIMHQTAILSVLSDSPDALRLCGDARSDSPGFSAKYSSYTLMDMTTSLILDQQLVTVSEVGSSVAMEVEGLERSLNFLISNRMKIGTIATDRHCSVERLLKETYPQINHQFDVWHISKSIKKKLLKRAQKKSQTELMPWIPCIGNHLWYSASTCGGNSQLLRERWLSCVHHVVDRHQWNGELVLDCGHGPLDNDGDEEFAWLSEDGDAHQALKSVVQDKRLLKDLGKCTDCCQTGPLESYHNLVLAYAPKRIHFQYLGMHARLQLAALDHNFNVDRSLATDKAGNPVVRQFFSKGRKEWVLRNVYESKTYTYLDELLHKIVQRRADDSICLDDPSCCLAVPSQVKPNLATKEKPDINVAISKRYKRMPIKKS